MIAVRKLLYFPFWAGIVLEAVGCVMDWVPGAEAGWFLAVAALSSAGLFIPKTTYRVAGVLVFVIALVVAYQAYHRQRLGP